VALPKRFTVEPIFAGCSVIVAAGGPSFSMRQVRTIARARLAPESKIRIIAVNDAIYPLFGVADWHHACDGEWWHAHIQTAHTFPGIKTTLSETIPEPWVTGYLENSGCEGFDPDPSRCRTGANSAYQAMHIAIHAGARRIILVGVDMRDGPAHEKHWFGDHPPAIGQHPVQYDSLMAPHFATLKPALEARRIEVLNASPGSALTAFPMAELEDALQG